MGEWTPASGVIKSAHRWVGMSFGLRFVAYETPPIGDGTLTIAIATPVGVGLRNG